MKSTALWFAILCIVLTAVPALAGNDNNNCQSPNCGGWSYDNGPISGVFPCALCANAWTINFGYIVSDTFIAEASNPVNFFQFGAWEFPGDVTTSLQWSITSGENGGTVYGSGTASGFHLTDNFISTNWYGYHIDLITVTGLNVSVTSGNKYWLNLQNAAVPSGDPVYWDQNGGKGCKSPGCPSQASESAVGTIPSESFTIGQGLCCTLEPGSTPEPSSIMLFGSGVLGLAGVLRRKLNL